MKRIFFLLITLFFLSKSFAQENMTFHSRLDYDVNLSDVWGWADSETGKEYALVGLYTGVSIVEVTDPNNVEEKAFISGTNSSKRDLKTFGNFAYVTSEASTGNYEEGLTIIDLSDLATSGEVTSFDWTHILPNGDSLYSCHNLYIDETGYCYLAGCNWGGSSGGIHIVDLFSNPGEPQFVASGIDKAIHDVYVRDNKLYASHIYDGIFTIYDVTDKQNIIELGSSPTLSNRTHNTWLSDDGNYIFTTDERENGTTGAYDISDLTDIIVLDQFSPLSTVGTGVIPHNVHVFQDWLLISHYVDGVIMVDASEPENLVEVGNYDTYTGIDTGFIGCWGVYPFLPSGNILVSDITNGLFVLSPNYVSACRIEGTVTDANTGTAIAFATATIDTEQLNEAVTDFTGEYKIGISTSGTYDVIYDAPGYASQTISTDLENGLTVVQNIELEIAERYDLRGTIVAAANGNPVPFAQVHLDDGFFEYFATADENGDFIFEQIFVDEYTVLAGQWGYEYKTQDLTVNADTEIEMVLNRGYQDDFIFDYNWEVSGDATSGQWERVEPLGNHPISDVDGDFGEFCYVTGNNGESDYVQNGITKLTSPTMDLTAYDDPTASFRVWFYNIDGSGILKLSVNNGIEEVILFDVEGGSFYWSNLYFNFPISPELVYPLKDYISITENMHLIIEAEGDGNLIEIGFDNLRITGGTSLPIREVDNISFNLNFSPNPFRENTDLTYQINSPFKQAHLIVYNQLGQLIHQEPIENASGFIKLGNTWQKGLYLFEFSVEGKILQTEKLIKY